jgi:ribonuclease P protein component
MAKPFGLGKEERLKSRKQIDHLFAAGKSFTVFPIRVTFFFEPAQATPVLQIGVSASKKYFKKAVHRNRVKRLLREAYRLQKLSLKERLQQNNLSGFLFFIYMDKSIASFETIQQSMARCLHQLEKRLPTKNEEPA